MVGLVLAVDDEPDVLELLNFNLGKAGLSVIRASDGTSAVSLAEEKSPDLILLDVMMPGIGGIEVCKVLRQRESTALTPIIMLTASGQMEDKIRGLESGADDYVTKPFSPKELVLRVKSLLRRSRQGQAQAYGHSFAGFEIDPMTRKCKYFGTVLDLTETEFKLLSLLVERNGHTLSREQLLSEVWGYRGSPDTRTVDTHVRRLRNKLGPAAASIKTVRGYGYRLVERANE